MAIAAVAELLVSVLAFGAELLVVALTSGVAAARERYQQRRQQRFVENATSSTAAEASGDAVEDGDAVKDSDARNTTAAQPQQLSGIRGFNRRIHPKRRTGTPLTTRQTTFVWATLLVSLGVGVGAVYVQHRVNEQRIADTTIRIERLVDDFAQQARDDSTPNPVPGVLNERDAWQQPLQLFVDETILGTLIVVRSSGPDRKTGSVDDLLAVRNLRPTLKEAGGKVIQSGAEALRDAALRLFKRKEDAEPID